MTPEKGPQGALFAEDWWGLLHFGCTETLLDVSQGGQTLEKAEREKPFIDLKNGFRFATHVIVAISDLSLWCLQCTQLTLARAPVQGLAVLGPFGLSPSTRGPVPGLGPP